MDVFWTLGYHATSLADLLEAMNVSRGSLYAAFGDKHALFLLALDRYIEDALVRLDGELDPDEDPLAGVRTCVNGYIDRIGGARGKRGCLLVATTMELAGSDVEVSRRIRRFYVVMETRLAEALERVRARGELVAGVEPTSAARMLVFLLEGMRVVGKTGPNRTVTQKACDDLLGLLTV